jgi:hypothetical protein
MTNIADFGTYIPPEAFGCVGSMLRNRIYDLHTVSIEVSGLWRELVFLNKSKGFLRWCMQSMTKIYILFILKGLAKWRQVKTLNYIYLTYLVNTSTCFDIKVLSSGMSYWLILYYSYSDYYTIVPLFQKFMLKVT